MRASIFLIGILSTLGYSQFLHNMPDVPRPCNEKTSINSADSVVSSIQMGDLGNVKFLIEKKNIPVNGCDKKGNSTPLTAAVKFNKTEIFEYLIKRGADISGRDNWGTPACYASLYGRDSLIIRLLDLGVSPNEKSNAGSSLLDFAVSEANYSTAAILLEKGADPQEDNEDGASPLVTAKRRSDSKMIELLESFIKKNR